MYSITQGMKVGGKVMILYIQHVHATVCLCLLFVTKMSVLIEISQLVLKLVLVSPPWPQDRVIHHLEGFLICSYLVTLQRTVIVPAEAGYGPKGLNEIPVGPSIMFSWVLTI